MIAATGKFILDEMTSCTVLECSKQPVLVCENCGGLMCVNHRKEIDKKEGKKRGCKYSLLGYLLAKVLISNRSDSIVH